MIVNMHEEGSLFGESEVPHTTKSGKPNTSYTYYTSKDKREEREIYVPSAKERQESEKQINKLTLSEMDKQYKVCLEMAKKYHLYHTDARGNKVSPAEIIKVFGNEKILKKDWVAFYAILSSPHNLPLYVNDLSKEEQELLQMIVANHYVSVHDAEKMLHKKMTETINSYYFWEQEEVLKDKYCMLYELVLSGGPRMPRRNGEIYLCFRQDARLDYFRTVYRDHLRMTTTDQLPADIPLKTYQAENEIFINFPLLNALYDSNQLELGKAKVSNSSVKNVQKVCSLKEFFSKEADKAVQSHYASLLANFFTLAAAASKISKENKVEDNIKAIVNDMGGYQYYLAPIMMPHIKGFRRNVMFPESYTSEMSKIMLDTLKAFAKDGWLNINDFIVKVRSYNEKAEQYFLWLSREGFNELTLENTYNGHRLWISNIITELTHPYVKAYMFMLAAFGVVELAYTEKPEIYDTCYFDTLKYIRLTNLGKYVLGISKTYQHKSIKEGKKFFELDDSSLIIRTLEENNPYLSLLGNMGNAISKKMYKVTYESFLEGCNNLEDINNKIGMFTNYICQDPPANWKEFFETLKKRCKPVTNPKKEYFMILIPASEKELQQIILNDPLIRKYTLRAEGLHLLIEKNYRTQVYDAFKKYGYLL